jgi:hypothetical protein
LYHEASGIDYRNKLLTFKVKIKNTGARDLPSLEFCVNKTSPEPAFPTIYKLWDLKVGETREVTFTYTIPHNGINGDQDPETGENLPIMLFLSNEKDKSPFQVGDEVTILDCKISVSV